MDARTKHAWFSLAVQEQGVECWLDSPRCFATLLLMVAEGIGYGFFVTDAQ